MNNAVWLGVPEQEIRKWGILQGDMNGRFAYYRCEIYLEEKGNAEILITANSRYRLWINEKPVLSGPCKGDRFRHFYEKVDISKYLRTGKNVFAVQVLFCDPNAVVHQSDERAPLFSVASLPGGHRLAVEGTIRNANGEILGDITTGSAPWKIWLDGTCFLTAGDEYTLNLGSVKEMIDFNHSPYNWKMLEFDALLWQKPRVMGMVVPSDFDRLVGLYGSHAVREREIPLLFEEPGDFLEGNWDSREVLTVLPGEKKEIILDAGVHTNAYMIYAFEKGAGAQVEMIYAEKYLSDDGKEIKRNDSVNGVLRGITDRIILNGQKVVYEPFWVRTFRFVKIVIHAGEEEVKVHKPIMRRTGYPLTVKRKPDFDEAWKEQLWEICIRTLQNCMLETYMDCPYYEQMQFSMDTRLQILFTYQVTDDTALAKKALEDFHCSKISEGLIQGKYPSAFPQIISTFSLYYIYMLEEYLRHTGDVKTVIKYRADVDEILEYYNSRMDERGLVKHLGYWEFVDWNPAWEETMGVPTAAVNDASTIINLMYAYALKSGAFIYRETGREAMAEEYENRRRELLERIQELCWDEERGLFREGPQTVQFSQHAQAWAVWNEMVSKDRAQEILRKTLTEKDILQCSFAASYELFRAFEWAGIYEETSPLMERWRQLLDMDCTTCPEVPENSRSECHAWSALPILELSRDK